MKDLDIVNCKECSSCICRVIDKNSIMYGCRKNKAIETNPNLFYNMPCFTKKKFRKKK